MKRCEAFVKPKGLSTARRCWRKSGHISRHSADLVGLRINNYRVLRRARMKKRKNGPGFITYWICKDKWGFIRRINSGCLLNGHSKGVKVLTRCGGIATSYRGAVRPEYRTVYEHHRFIFRRQNPNYCGMPFYDQWNPDKGGSFIFGLHWILKHLGKRPSSRHSLDIIEHYKGFVPGNLRWTLLDTQRRNQKHRTMFLLTVSQHKEALRQAGYGIYKLKGKK